MVIFLKTMDERKIEVDLKDLMDKKIEDLKRKVFE